MKKIGLFFSIAFFMFLIGQILWTIGLLYPEPLFGNQNLEDWVINILFTLCSIFGLIASIRLYQKNK